MAYIEERRRTLKDGTAGPKRYRARVTGPSGKERSKTFDRRRDAEAWAGDVEHGRRRGKWVRADGKVKFSEWVERWWDQDEDVAAMRHSTTVRTRGVVDNYLLPAFADWPLVEVDRQAVRAWARDLRMRGLAPRTVRKIVQTLSGVLGAAVEEDVLVANPAAGVKLPKPPKTEMMCLVEEQVFDLADCIDPRYRAWVLLSGFAGPRFGETVALRRSRVDLLRGTVIIKEGGVEAGGRVVFGPPKSDNGFRTLHPAGVVMRALDAHLAEHSGPGAEDFVFPSPQGSVLRASTFRSRFWLPATKRAGLEGLRIHDLRHTAITLWLAAGVPIEEVTLDAGHDDPAFTIRNYVHRRPGAQERTRERLDAVLDDIAERPRAPIRRLAG